MCGTFSSACTVPTRCRRSGSAPLRSRDRPRRSPLPDPPAAVPNCAKLRAIASIALGLGRQHVHDLRQFRSASRLSRAIGEADRRQRIFQLVRHLPRRLAERLQPLGFDLPRTRRTDRSAICRMRRRITSNSGAPRCGFPAGSGSPRATSSVHSTSSLSGRLNCRLKCPAARHASSDRMSEPAIARITIAARDACREILVPARLDERSRQHALVVVQRRALRCRERRALHRVEHPAPAHLHQLPRPLPAERGQHRTTPAAPPSSSTLVGTIANSAR